MSTNPNVIVWPSDNTGRSAPIKAAILACGNVLNEDTEDMLIETIRVGARWLKTRCKTNRADAVKRQARSEARVAAKEESNRADALASVENEIAELGVHSAYLQERLTELGGEVKEPEVQRIFIKTNCGDYMVDSRNRGGGRITVLDAAPSRKKAVKAAKKLRIVVV